MHKSHVKTTEGVMYLDEAAVEREVVSDGVLPGSLVGAVVRESLHDELVDA